MEKEANANQIMLSKDLYLSKLFKQDRVNIEKLIEDLESCFSTLEHDICVLAVGGSARHANGHQQGYFDIDLDVFELKHTKYSLDRRIYDFVNDKKEFEVAGKAVLTRFDALVYYYLLRHFAGFIPYKICMGGLTLKPKEGKEIDIRVLNQINISRHLGKYREPFAVLYEKQKI